MPSRPLVAVVALVAAGALAVGCADDEGVGAPVATAAPITAPAGVERLEPRVVAKLPHDVEAFTQGLELDGDVLVESTGGYGTSDIRRVDPATGEVLVRRPLADERFGEGLTRVGDRWLQLTWREQVVVAWDADLTGAEELPYPYEGWGLCALDDDRLAATDGTATLRLLDPDDLTVLDEVEVTLDGQPLDQLNELECVDGAVWANVWHRTDVVRIDPAGGEVTAVLDASSLAAAVQVRDPGGDVLNGIAHDPATGRFFLTGKHWPTLFEVELVPAAG